MAEPDPATAAFVAQGDNASSPRRPFKTIVVFSDGTGNSAAKLFKTNVWRLYRAVDTGTDGAGLSGLEGSGQERPGQVRPGQARPVQIVAYDNGVGTSSFKPLALLGGVFGVGLKRNVLDLYRFICLNYEPGDRIYAFGFSRGAFTIRVLIGLITRIGLVDRRRKRANLVGMGTVGAATIPEADLRLLAGDAYRRYRRGFVLGGDPRRLRAKAVDGLRNLRDRWIARCRQRNGKPLLADSDLLPVAEIAFVGVWDTVAAYGTPIAEITKGIDRWVWPISMPNYRLSPKVRCARHALALDDERQTFHPLLWDEVNERELVAAGEVTEGRLRQVWFAGMHSDVGGGYADDALAHVPLLWMAREAMAAGLCLHPADLAQFEREADPHGPMHDSRAGLGGYYRYQPRKISARLEHPDPTTRIFQDPDLTHGLLTDVVIHDSVQQRIERGGQRYAPIVLPSTYRVENAPVQEKFATARAAAQERVWDTVWRRRVHYFASLGISIALFGMVLLPPAAASCSGPQCVLAPLIRTIGGVLPAFAQPWVAAYAAHPAWFLALVVSILLLLRSTRRTEVALRDLMRQLLLRSMTATGKEPPPLFAQAAHPTRIRILRCSDSYQRVLQTLKWRAAPAAAGLLIHGILWALFGSALVVAVYSVTGFCW